MTEKIFYADREIQEWLKTDFELIESKGWYLLYRNTADRSYWRMDQYDRLQHQVLVKLDTIESWDEFDDTELRIQLLRDTRGQGKEKCMWMQCERMRLQGLAYCERHAYKEGGIRR